jgi:hypothetical protein
MRHEQVGAARGGLEIRISIAHAWREQLADDDLGAARGIHHAGDEGAVRRIDVGTDRVELDPFVNDEVAVVRAGGENGRVAARLQAPREADVREQVAVRSPAGQDDPRGHEEDCTRKPKTTPGVVLRHP